ncbi:uncharacterized protein KIAA0825 homolog [Eurytemora carolleeae]|uniref:uncharacterized protein KIAA0825 homolog n=1 Tax=Eurytemora carolleeae TaxID=1294199 RepID=UPI000C77CECA|nr:uncharacterized protein KIAA0825 homolog [Eurytemora carolleeae]|eukprot:XP_023321128.1 uncharacterized protein KIAA0825 homolog [Eurytemora affinis]
MMLRILKTYLEQPSYTVGREEVYEFKTQELLELTKDMVQQELRDLVETGKLVVETICPVRYGGVLDYPKQTVESANLISRKWDICLAKLTYNQKTRFETQWEDIIMIEPSCVEDTKPEDIVDIEDFYNSIRESAQILLLHFGEMTEYLVRSGDMEKLGAVAGGIALVRNKLWFYCETLGVESNSCSLNALYRETCDLLESLSEQMNLFYSSNLATVILQDSESQDWEDPRPFHEGERISYCIQMWSFYLESTR